MRLAPIALALLLAGCATAPSHKDASPQPAPSPASAVAQAAAATAPSVPRPQVFHVHGVFGPEAMTVVAGTVSPDSHNTTLQADVRTGATGLVAELVWKDQASDLDLYLQGPNFCKVAPVQYALCLQAAFFGDPSGTGSWRNDGGRPGQGDSPVRIRLSAQDLQAAECQDGCPWTLIATAKATPGTPFDLYASVFYGTAPPDGYTAVPA